MFTKTWFVVDFADDCILYSGSKKNCIQMQSESYGGLTIVGYKDLTVSMQHQANQQFI